MHSALHQHLVLVICCKLASQMKSIRLRYSLWNYASAFLQRQPAVPFIGSHTRPYVHLNEASCNELVQITQHCFSNQNCRSMILWGRARAWMAKIMNMRGTWPM